MKIRREIIIILSLLILISACSKPVELEEKEEEGAEIVEETEDVEEPLKYICTLTGLEVLDEADINQRPIAVMIDNEINARPQSGLDSADIVYEMPVEGNITRYMAIYHHLSSEKIGPVRSARSYFIDKALEFNGIYVHCGGSPQALKDLDVLKVDTFNDLKGTPVFWRSTDRKMPHNLYTNTKYMREISETKKLENKKAPVYFDFSDEFLIPDGGLFNKIILNYDRSYKVSFIYDKESNKYYRYINGTPMKDHDTNNDIYATNIIVEKVGIKVLDKVGRLELANIGKGKGYFLTGGRLIEVEWQKDSRNGRTLYKDLNGNEIKLNKGITWIQVVSQYTKIEFEE